MLTEAQFDIICCTNRLLVSGDLERTEKRCFSALKLRAWNNMPGSCNTVSFQSTKKSVTAHESLFIVFDHGFPLSPKFVIDFPFCLLNVLTQEWILLQRTPIYPLELFIVF